MNMGNLKDKTLDNRKWMSSGREIFQMGKADQWTIVDLRPLRQDYFYSRKFVQTESLHLIFRRFDLMIIAPTEDFN